MRRKKNLLFALLLIGTITACRNNSEATQVVVSELTPDTSIVDNIPDVNSDSQGNSYLNSTDDKISTNNSTAIESSNGKSETDPDSSNQQSSDAPISSEDSTVVSSDSSSERTPVDEDSSSSESSQTPISSSEDEQPTSSSVSGVVASYYSKINFSQTKATLKTALCNLIYSHTNVGYDGLWNAYKTTDVLADGKTIWDMYSACKFEVGGSKQGASYKKEGDAYNREHTIPQSIFNKNAIPRADLFHVYPTDGYVNNVRSNYPHAEVVDETNTYVSTNNTKIGRSATSGVSGKVCEPADEYKGDFARTYFYFVTCYEKNLSGYKDFATFTQNSYPSLSSWAITLYKKWSKEDPVSEKEINRNEAVYKIQKNRNPFIDFPGLEDKIW